eukprot:TRINITY_DN28305_c0_g1_i2.p2 TRINITY_DN28305_c0_g1~~TRINITY_DN28305_c0_g1_i2.p2  ORF type:complete len:108 (-),score=29.47 TRINITY_DN28305_c0_g1_i2:48-371(-)
MAEARLYTQYKEEIVPKLKEEFTIENVMSIPKLEKIVINVGVGEAIQDKKVLDTIVANIAQITGQMPVTTKAKTSICLLYTSDAADDLLCVDLGGRRIIKKKKTSLQ